MKLDHSPESTECAFVSGPGNDLFALPGDSGAFVLAEADAALVGMVLAGNLGTEWAYVSPITMILADIEERTGCRVRLATELA